MKIRPLSGIDKVVPEGTDGVTMQVGIGKAEGAPRFAMRYFVVRPGSATPKHTHWWEHEVFVAGGKGEVHHGDKAYPIAAGDMVYVEPDELHQFRNTGGEPLEFVCVVPHPE
ncbi:MAG: cupin domain-containing protein [Candidatus Eisenbacteria bacterium]|nr:cupin domain-containing protein [Candidatus Eisenbacteria bacterium]